MFKDITMKINGQIVHPQKGWTLLESARFYGIDIPTLCYNEGLSAWGGCRLCIVEIGEGKKSRLVSSCTYPVEEGLVVKTHSTRVINTRKMLVEVLLSTCHTSKTVQDLASKLGVRTMRFELKNSQCIYCGLCVRMCKEQMQAGAIGFKNRGGNIKIATPFDKTSEQCRRCGACIYICPACQLRCDGPNPKNPLCGGCLNLTPTCTNVYDDMMCFMGPKGECGTCIKGDLNEKRGV